MATISRFQAMATIGHVQASDFFGWLLWLAVHLVALTGFKNRIAVLANWTIAFLANGRPQRAITAQQVFARQALEAQAAAIASADPACAIVSGVPAPPAHAPDVPPPPREPIRQGE